MSTARSLDSGTPLEDLAVSYFNYHAVGKQLDWAIKHGWAIKESPFAVALASVFARLHCKEAVSKRDEALAAVPLVLTEGDNVCGTIGNVDVSMLRSIASPSSFGRGEETVYDETVRKGFEIRADQMHFDMEAPAFYDAQTVQDVFNDLALELQRRLFPRQPVKLIFYKLALYEPGGHFSAHRDSTHDDSHHGTLLIGCKARGEDAYEGGEFRVTTSVGVKDFRVDEHGWLAFYTDCQHAVKPVTAGTRMTLQFDVYLESSDTLRPHTVACVDAQGAIRMATDTETEREGEVVGGGDVADRSQFHDDTDSDFSGDGCPSDAPDRWLDPHYRRRQPHHRDVRPFLLHSFVEKVSDVLHGRFIPRDKKGRSPAKRRRSPQPKTVILPLRHLYRRASLIPEYLKGVDKALVDLLQQSTELSVRLHTVVYHNIDGGEGGDTWECLGLAFANETFLKEVSKPVVIVKRPVFASHFMGEEPCIEHTGNDAQAGASKYVMGAMFISLKGGASAKRRAARRRRTLLPDEDSEDASGDNGSAKAVGIEA